MSNFEKNFSYESLLENLRATHESRKKRFEEKKHLLNDEDLAIERTLFSLEDDALMRNDKMDDKEKLFNFDEYMNEINGADSNDILDSPRDQDSSSMNNPERKHICPKPGCNKSYTSSHGLKYHLEHGHIKEKENAYKPFICNVKKCQKAYRNSNGLKYHMSKAHPSENH
ncbi:juxtaposed with another zinc finger protein 1 [Enteropsectra breve]|nr:juxtaposed with another zinc finger protein 1 [Enteropsectra breve]